MLDVLRPLGNASVIAHRGACRRAPENSLAAFRLAAELGADMVELDVRRTADGRLAVHHDARLADGRPVIEVAAAALPSEVPELETALEACAGVTVNVEIKHDPGEPGFEPARRIADDVARVVGQRGDEDRVLISSFDLAAVDRVRAIAPRIATAWLVVDPPPAVVELLRTRGHQALHPWFAAVTEQLVASAHAAGIGVNCWTCDEPERMRELFRMGVDGVCTNVPDVARDVRAGL